MARDGQGTRSGDSAMKSNKWALAAMLFAGGSCLAMAATSARDKPHAAIGAWGFDTAGMEADIRPGDGGCAS